MKDLALAYEIRRKSRIKSPQKSQETSEQTQQPAISLNAQSLAKQIRSKRKPEPELSEETLFDDTELFDNMDSLDTKETDEIDPKQARLSKILSK